MKTIFLAPKNSTFPKHLPVTIVEGEELVTQLYLAKDIEIPVILIEPRVFQMFQDYHTLFLTKFIAIDGAIDGEYSSLWYALSTNYKTLSVLALEDELSVQLDQESDPTTINDNVNKIFSDLKKERIKNRSRQIEDDVEIDDDTVYPDTSIDK